jgi:hypothetical protein
MTDPEARYEVQHFDHAWGGWRAVPVSWRDDTPFRTDLLEEAVIHLTALRSLTRVFRYRLFDRVKARVYTL